jgi:hypothetical protein
MFHAQMQGIKGITGRLSINELAIVSTVENLH